MGRKLVTWVNIASFKYLVILEFLTIFRITLELSYNRIVEKGSLVRVWDSGFISGGSEYKQIKRGKLRGVKWRKGAAFGEIRGPSSFK